MVKMDNNDAVMQVHVNKLRPFIAGINSVIYGGDIDFSHVEAMPVADEDDIVLPSQQIDRSRWSHLTIVQQEKLNQVLDEFHLCFSDKPGYCDLLLHQFHVHHNLNYSVISTTA